MPSSQDTPRKSQKSPSKAAHPGTPRSAGRAAGTPSRRGRAPTLHQIANDKSAKRRRAKDTQKKKVAATKAAKEGPSKKQTPAQRAKDERKELKSTKEIMKIYFSDLSPDELLMKVNGLTCEQRVEVERLKAIKAKYLRWPKGTTKEIKALYKATKSGNQLVLLKRTNASD